jgi:hypothetical protein
MVGTSGKTILKVINYNMHHTNLNAIWFFALNYTS